MQRRLFTLCLFVLAVLRPTPLASQQAGGTPESARGAHRLFLGAAIAITAEPNYRPGETAVLLNVVPIVAEWAFATSIGVRLQSLVNLDLKTGQLGHVGAGLTLPFYLAGTPHAGWYAGPYGGLAGVSELGGSDLTLAVEGGPRWGLTDNLTLGLAIQAGATRIVRPGHASKWVTHLGAYPSLGLWF